MSHRILFFITQTLFSALLTSGTVMAAPPVFQAEIIASFPAANAYQGVAVDADAFYTVNNRRIIKHDKNSGQQLGQLSSASDGTANNSPLIHMDSAMEFEGTLVVAHSNYPDWPMTGSIELWNSNSLKHLASRSFEDPPGSLTWIDYDGESWWGAFANYDLVQPGMTEPYGETRNTIIVKLADDYSIVASWQLPEEILARLTPMSNSGGSWGADGKLYLSGHDRPEIYVMKVPESDSTLEWVATIEIDGYAGQGIAWDRTTETNTLWGINRSDARVYQIKMPVLPD